MPAMSAQQAPKKAEHAPKGAGTQQRNTQPTGDQGKSGGLKEKLHRLPQAAGMALLAVLLVVSLFVGNFRALQNETPKAFLRQGDVKAVVESRLDAAQNVLTVAERAGLSEDAMAAARSAMGELKQAKTARAISRADQRLTAAISQLTTAELSGETARSMMSAADDFSEMGSFLRQEARTYNQGAKKAADLYEKLPTKFVLPEPDIYEGI